MPKQISVEGNGHCCYRPSSNWETNHARWVWFIAFLCNYFSI